LAPAETAAVADRLAAADACIQSTTLGLAPGDALPFPPEMIPQNVAVMDMIYRQTPVLEALAARGIRTADGRAMLLHQGVKSLSLWTGRGAPVDAMREALAAALAARG
jgi:shikimate dehydrogenase